VSRTQPTESQQAELRETCADCGAKPGDWCTTKSGRWTGYLHSSRYYLARARVQRVRHSH